MLQTSASHLNFLLTVGTLALLGVDDVYPGTENSVSVCQSFFLFFRFLLGPSECISLVIVNILVEIISCMSTESNGESLAFFFFKFMTFWNKNFPNN